MDGAGHWNLIESDPGVFSELITELGVQGVQVEELYGLDEDGLQALQPVYGLIFLFKWDPSLQTGACIQHEIADLFFAKQVITNACATQALLSVLLNAPGIELGPVLDEIKLFGKELPPDIRGLALSNSDRLRAVHNSFARQETFEIVSDETEKDAFHFVAYIPFQGRVYELDGLREGPVDHGKFEGEWTAHAAKVIRERTERYSSSEIRFNLLAVVGDRLEALATREELLQAQLASLQSSMDDGEGAAKAAALQQELQTVSDEVQGIKEKRAQQKAENARRRFNYIPFFVAALRALASKDKLPALVAAAQAKAEQRLQERRAKGGKGKSKGDSFA